MRASGSRLDRKRPSVFDDTDEELRTGKQMRVFSENLRTDITL